MFIKASGSALKDMNAGRGWRRLRLDKVLGVINDKRLAKLPTSKREPEIVNQLLLSCCDDFTSTVRPSVEANLHALLDKCVIHLHPVVIGAYVNAKRGREEIEKLFKNEKFPPLWIPYAPPGFSLAKKVARFIAGYQKRYRRIPAIMLLAKHGLFVTAPTPDAAMTITKRVIKKCNSILPESKSLRLPPPAEKDVRFAKLAIRKAVFAVTKQHTPVSHFYNKDIAGFMRRADAAKLLSKGVLGPAELVYANGEPLWVETPCVDEIAAGVKKLVDRNRKPPTAFIVKGLGLFVAADKKTAPIITEVATGSLMVRNWASQFGGVCALTADERNFIIKWGIEAPQHNMQ
jgi:rhamnose utilization protein RhaD (predicted bifunctional aldolase and dehydrogenase)